MKVQILAGVIAVLVLAGCESRYNPGNWGWFGGGRSEPTLAPRKGYVDDSDPRPVIDQVVSMTVDKVPGGAVVTAVGLPRTQGYYAADLISTYETEAGKPAAKDGVMRLEFRIVPPRQPRPVVNQASREVVSAFYLSDQALQSVRQITVVGARNQVSSRR
ncbi:hypothetical protein CLV78_10946 [Aliiruegeria haliotis]|uniref:Lipoprotein n=1 Tax=Aliiruegeria haliotis TaxID=1280846 RepID=A0A2T0RJT2_9RHOB|nr:hypothetical protein [Aliiruegeria haliotis]PRY21433.1 hypothetical protein CLV78_10946 [Aliiruegeria haliotis]